MQAEHLPIYKAAHDLCLWLEQVVRGFPRFHKYAIGSDLRESARRILRLVVRANTRTDKTQVLRVSSPPNLVNTTDRFVGDPREPALHQVHPRRVGRGEVNWTRG